LQPVREAIAAHGKRLRVLLEESDAQKLAAVARFARDRGADVSRVRRAELDRLSRGVRHQGAIAFAPALVLRPLAALDLAPPALVVVLDSIEDPQNFGAVIRSSVAFGASAVVWPEHGAAPLTPATFRASAGAVEHAQLCSVPNLPEALDALRVRGLRIIGLDATAGVAIDHERLSEPLALVLGREGVGLHKSVRKACDVLVHLPMKGPIASLNVSAAAAIALYEAARHRRPTSEESRERGHEPHPDGSQ
jgi:23S rRNA (guanosine2251-2'-O)-methyltransferase